jgi:SRSO17 transposase
MAYVKNGFRLLLDFRLYLPENWTEDRSRCDSAAIPLEFQRFRTKAELAYDLICQAIEAKIKFSFVAMDGFYGKHPWLLTRIEKKGITYVADIGCKDRVIIEKPEYGIPPKKSLFGRNPSIIRVLNTIPVSVDEIEKTIARWRIIRIRESTEGFLEVKFTALRVWRIDKDVNEPIPVWLLIRKDLDDSNVKYSLCNASPIQTWSKLARMQSERYWIERSFQDAIDLAGMADYQVRNWDAWHHHMALVLLAMLWVTKEQKHFLGVKRRITLQDVAKIIQTLIPLKPKTPLSIAKIIIRNHRNRKDSRRCKMKKKKGPLVC